eukprot:TRINITY_DN2175_c0_g1_i14.p1 TRINITY_DN2175_c0_g1~~TRINITY_DN2175_c0_g1_i14.p1  ORF type:complete len:402 (-),score=140.85 TRINITY_DN2175_c0_g1_i14:604-1686(-)
MFSNSASKDYFGCTEIDSDFYKIELRTAGLSERRFKEVRSVPSLASPGKMGDETPEHLTIEDIPIAIQCDYALYDSPRSNGNASLNCAGRDPPTEETGKYTAHPPQTSDEKETLNGVRDKEKSEIIERQNKEIMDMQIACRSLSLKCRGCESELANYKEIISEHIKSIDETVASETHSEMQGELMARQHVVEVLTHERDKYDETIKSLKAKLSESKEEIVAVEQRQVDIEELKETFRKVKDDAERLMAELKAEKESNGQLAKQVKELIQRCDEYAEKQKNDESNSVLRNKQLKEDLIILKRENEELKHQIAEWQSMAAMYKEQEATADKKGDASELRSILTVLKEQAEALSFKALFSSIL